MKKNIIGIMALFSATVAWGQTDVTSDYLKNADFEGSYGVFAEPNGDRALYQPEGWELSWSPVNENDMSIMTMSDKATDSFSAFTVNDEATRGKQTYWARYRWGTNTTMKLSQTVNLPAGMYRLTADVLNYSSDKNLSARLFAGVAQVDAVPSTEKADNWTTLECNFYVEQDGEVELGFTAIGGPAVEHIFGVDNFKLYKLDAEEPSEGHPVSVTGYIVNPTFNYNVDGWTATTGAQNKGRASNKGGDITGGFFENWNGSAYSGTIEQSLNNLPLGKYTLKVAAFRSGGSGNVYAFANASETAVTTDDGAFVEVPVTVTDGTMTIGIKSVDGGANWMGLDNVSLTYLGADLTELQANLAALRATATTLKESGETMSSLVMAALTGALTETENVEATTKTLQAAANTLSVAISKANVSIANNKLFNGGVVAADVLDNWTCTNGNKFQVNTWSTEGNSDGSNMTTPFIENWVASGGLLNNGVITYTLEGMEPGLEYTASVLVRVLNEAGEASTGLTMYANEMKSALASGKACNKGFYGTYSVSGVVGEDGVLKFGFEIANPTFNWVAFKDVKIGRFDNSTVLSTIESLKKKASEMANEKPLSIEEKANLEAAVSKADELSGSNSLVELNNGVEALNNAMAAANTWRTAYENAKTPLVEAMERFERDYNDGENGALRPMSAEAWNTLLEAVKVAAVAKDVTDSYDGFIGAAETFNAAMDAVEPSIRLYAGFADMMSVFRAYGEETLKAAAEAVDTEASRATDASLRAAIATMDEAFTAYRNLQDGDFNVSGLLGENLDFETVGDAVTGPNGAYSTVFDIPGWKNVYVGNPTAGNMQYIHKEQSTDVSADVTTGHSIYMRSKWDQIETKLQISKETYLPSGEYLLSFYAKRTQSSAIKEDLCYYEIGEKKTLMTLGEDWEKYTVEFTLSEPTMFSLSFGFLRATGATDADVYADDVTLVCHSQTAFARALAAAQEQAPSSRAAQAAYDEYKDVVEADMTTDEKAEAVAVLNNSVTMAQNGEYATSLIKNADFTGGTDSHALKGSGGQVNTPKEWDFVYDFEGWNDTFVKTDDDGNGVFNLWAGIILQGELMQEVTALPNGVYRLTADLVTDTHTTDGSSWVALYGYPTGDYNGIGRADNVTCGDPAEFANYEVLFRVSRHAATVGVRSDARYYQLKNIRLEYVEDNEDNAVKVENARLLQKAYVDRNNPVVDLTAFDKASGVQVYKNLKNGVIKAASEGQVLNTVNVVVDGVCKNYELTEGEPYAMSEGFAVENAVYSREMTAEWGTLMLPYALASDDNIQYYKLTGTRTADDVDYMIFTTVDEVPANTPCVFRRLNENSPVMFTATNAEITPMSDATVTEETELVDWSVVGYYEKTVITDSTELASTYYISGGKFMNATKSLTVSPFRATFVNTMANEVNMFMIDFNDNGTTGVKNASTGAALAVFGERGALRLVAGQATVRYAVYTMAGVLAAQGALHAGEEYSCELPAGIYIVNGLKVQVK